MPRLKKETPTAPRIIFMLLSPFGKKFFIGHCKEGALRETYRQNLKSRRQLTSRFISEIYPERPCVFVLERVDCTTDFAMNLTVAWTKIFVENGYQSYNKGGLQEMSKNLYIDTQALYDKRKNVDIREITACKNCSIPRFNRETCERYPFEKEDVPPIVHEEIRSAKRDKEIRIMVSREEYEAIDSYAKKKNMKLSPYIRTVAQSPEIVIYDYNKIAEHTKEIAEIRNAINRLIFTIEATNNYLPKEIDSIVKLVNALFQSENMLIKELRKERAERNGVGTIEEDEDE